MTHISHGAGIPNQPRSESMVDWFIVEPRDDPDRLAAQVDSLRRAGRTVREIVVGPYEGKR